LASWEGMVFPRVGLRKRVVGCLKDPAA